MEKCLNNPGLMHIGEKILGHLPFKDKVTCRLVQKSCKNILDNLALKVGIDDLLLMLQKDLIMPRKIKNPCYDFDLLFEEWSDFLKQILLDVKNPWASIYIQNLFKRIKAMNRNLVSPLSTFGINFGNPKMVKFIMEKGTKNLDDYNKSIVNHLLYSVVEKGNIEILICLKPFLTKEIISNINLLHMAAGSGYVEIVKFLLCHNQVLTKEEDIFGNRPMFYAINKNDIETVKVIANYLNEDDLSEDANSFHLAAMEGYYEILNFLCQKVTNLNVLNKDGDTPLHLAARFGHFEVVKLLSSYTSEVNITNYHGVTPIECAKLNGYIEIANYLDRMVKKTKFCEIQ